MPTVLKQRTFRGLRTEVTGKALKDAQRVELKKVGKKTVDEFNKVVSNWSAKSKPKFINVVRDNGPGKPITLFIQVRGNEHQVGIWDLLDTEGRDGSGKIVQPKSFTRETVNGKHGSYQTFKRLRFPSKYIPKTAGAGIGGGPGVKFGPFTRAQYVPMSTITPRFFSRRIRDKFFKKEALNAGRRGARQGIATLTGQAQK